MGPKSKKSAKVGKPSKVAAKLTHPADCTCALDRETIQILKIVLKPDWIASVHASVIASVSIVPRDEMPCMDPELVLRTCTIRVREVSIADVELVVNVKGGSDRYIRLVSSQYYFPNSEHVFMNALSACTDTTSESWSKSLAAGPRGCSEVNACS